VATLCARLDGLPLAIELAAARTTYFAPQVLLEQVEQGLSVLSRGARDLPARQQSLRGSIAWSCELLAQEEQQLFRRLAVFVDDCTWQAAEQVCTAAGRLNGDLLEGLLALMNQSLLRPEEQAGGTERVPRFRMLQLLREFGLEQLEHAGEREVTQQAHAAYYLALAEEANAHWNEIEWPQWLDTLEREHGNLQVALTFLLERAHSETEAGKAHAEQALRFCLALDYLSEEVLSQLPEPVLSFLFHTSILDRLCAPLCDAVTGQEGSQAILELLEHANLFVVPLDDERRWYRYHHLFADALQSRLHQIAPALVPELHRRASAWFEEQGLATEAVQHALAAADLERAARLLEQVGRPIILRGQLQTVSGWLDALPEALLRTRPLLSLYHAITLQNSNQLEAAERCLADAEQHIPADLSAEQARLLLAPVATIRASNAFYVGDLAQGIALAQSILEMLPETERETRPFALMEVAYAFLVSGEVGPAAERLITQAQATAQELGSPFSIVT